MAERDIIRCHILQTIEGRFVYMMGTDTDFDDKSEFDIGYYTGWLDCINYINKLVKTGNELLAAKEKYKTAIKIHTEEMADKELEHLLNVKCEWDDITNYKNDDHDNLTNRINYKDLTFEDAKELIKEKFNKYLEEKS